MTDFDDQQKSISNIPVTVTDFILDYCELTHGVGLCTSTASSPCYNTYSTCRAKLCYVKGSKTYRYTNADTRLPMESGERPYVKSLTYMPTEIKNSLTVNARLNIELYDEPDTDVGIDPYRSTRASVQGSYFKKLLARNSNYKGRICKQYDGYIWKHVPIFGGRVKWATGIQWATGIKWMNLDEVLGGWVYALRQRFVGMIDNVTMNKGMVKFEIVDMLKKLADITIPPKLNVNLAAEMNAIQTQLTVIGDGIEELPSSGYIKIDDEIIHYHTKNPVTGILGTCIRGYFGTVAATHSADTLAQTVRYFAPGNAFDHMKTILLNDCGITPPYVAYTSFNTERDSTWGRNDVKVSAIICEPEKAETIYFELVEFMNCRSWVGENLKIKIKRNTPNDPGRIYTHLTGIANIIKGSGSVDLNQKSKLSRISLYWNRHAELKNNDPQSFDRLDIAVNGETESINEDNAITDKTLFCRWLRTGYEQEEKINAFAKNMPSRLLGQVRDAMPIIAVSVALKDADVLTGDYVHLSTGEVQDKNGNDLVNAPFVVVKREPKKNEIALKLLRLSPKKYCVIAPASYAGLTYANATESEREYGFICDENKLMSNGDDGYRIW